MHAGGSHNSTQGIVTDAKASLHFGTGSRNFTNSSACRRSTAAHHKSAPRNAVQVRKRRYANQMAGLVSAEERRERRRNQKVAPTGNSNKNPRRPAMRVTWPNPYP